MAAPSLLTKLDAVNEMLHDLGDRKTDSLTSPTRSDVIRAVDTLDNVSRRFQSKGWWFNTERVTLAINGSNQFVIPADYVHVEQISGGPTAGSGGTPFLVIRDRLLYDTVNQTDTFPGSADVVLVVTRLLDYEDLPSTARDYVYAAASVRMQSRTLGSQYVDRDLQIQARSAYATLLEEDLDAQDIDITYSSHFIDLMHNR